MTETDVLRDVSLYVSCGGLPYEADGNAGRGGVVEVKDKVAVLLGDVRRLLGDLASPQCCDTEGSLTAADERGCWRRLRFLEYAHAFVERQRVTQKTLRRNVASVRLAEDGGMRKDGGRGRNWRQYSACDRVEVAIMVDEERMEQRDEGCPTRHVLCFSTVLHEKALGLWSKGAAVQRQGEYCKQCLDPLLRYKFPFSMWTEARFCHFTGLYYCKMCHVGRRAVIPARVIRRWDFKPRPVCNDAFQFLNDHAMYPVYRVRTFNPALYDRVALLRVAHNLRLQLMKLREVGMKCPVFRYLLYLHDAPVELERENNRHLPPGCTDPPYINLSTTFVAADAAAASFAADCYVPRARRYLLENCESWAISDLEDVHRGQVLFQGESNGHKMPLIGDVTFTSHLAAYSKGAAAFCGECDTVVYLKKMRSRVLRHMLAHNCLVCLRNGVDLCGVCCPEDLMQKFGCTAERKAVGNASSCSSLISVKDPAVLPFVVYVFDILHVTCCTQCGSAYHKSCLKKLRVVVGESRGCPRCDVQWKSK